MTYRKYELQWYSESNTDHNTNQQHSNNYSNTHGILIISIFTIVLINSISEIHGFELKLIR